MMPGQPWSAKNQAERIMFGGLYVTIMDPDSASTDGSETVPPFQTRVGRRYYKGIDNYTVRSGRYGGGKRFNVSTRAQVETGGYWHNGKDKAVSFSGRTVFIGGNYSPDGAFSDHELATCCIVSPNIARSINPGAITLGCKYTLVQVLRIYSYPSWTYRLLVSAVKIGSGGQLIISGVYNRVIFTGSIRSYCTDFDFTGRKIAFYDSMVHATYNYDISQTVSLLSFVDNYATNTTDTIYTGAPERRSITYTIETTSESTNLSDWLYSNTRSQSLTAGDPFVVDIKMDGTDVCLLRQRTISYSLSQSDTALSIGYLSRSGYSHFSKSVATQIALQVCKLTFGGVLTVWEPISPLVNSDNQTSNTDVSASPRNATVTVSVSSAIHRADVLFYSFRKRTLIYRDYLTSENDTGSGSGDSSSYSGGQTDITDYSADYRIKGDTVDASLSSSTVNNTATTSLSWPSSIITFLSAENGAEYSTTTYPAQIVKSVTFSGRSFDFVGADNERMLLACGRFGATSSAMSDKTVQVDLTSLAHVISDGRIDIASGASYSSQICCST